MISIPTSGVQKLERAPQAYVAFVQFSLMKCGTDENPAKLETEYRSLRQGPFPPLDFAQHLWSRTQIRGFAYDGIALKGMFLDVKKASICKILSNWWEKYKEASPEDVFQK